MVFPLYLGDGGNLETITHRLTGDWSRARQQLLATLAQPGRNPSFGFPCRCIRRATLSNPVSLPLRIFIKISPNTQPCLRCALLMVSRGMQLRSYTVNAKDNEHLLPRYIVCCNALVTVQIPTKSSFGNRGDTFDLLPAHLILRRIEWLSVARHGLGMV